MADTSWLNRMITLRCLQCGWEWVQPTDSGKCPTCHSANTAVLQRRINELPRV